MNFNKTITDVLLTYELKSILDCELAEALVADIRAELEKSHTWKAIVFDFQENAIDHRAFKALTPLGLELRRLTKKMYALSKNRMVHSEIRNEGMSELLKPIKSLGDLSLNLPTKKTPLRLDVNFINPFIESTIHVLNVQCKTVVTPQKLALKSDAGNQFSSDIAGIVGITSKSFTGSISLCFPSVIFLELMSEMLGEKFEQITDDLKDGAAELTNIIFSRAKKVLNEKGYSIERALPSVATGSDLKIIHSGADETVILPFVAGANQFFIEIGIEQV